MARMTPTSTYVTKLGQVHRYTKSFQSNKRYSDKQYLVWAFRLQFRLLRDLSTDQQLTNSNIEYFGKVRR